MLHSQFEFESKKQQHSPLPVDMSVAGTPCNMECSIHSLILNSKGSNTRLYLLICQLQGPESDGTSGIDAMVERDCKCALEVCKEGKNMIFIKMERAGMGFRLKYHASTKVGVLFVFWCVCK